MTAERAEVAGRFCMVTGANGSMGRVIATELARRGATVIVVCRTAGQGEALRDEIVQATGRAASPFSGTASSRDSGFASRFLA